MKSAVIGCIKLLAVLCAIFLFLEATSVAQKVTTVAGGFLGDGRTATKAAFQIPYGIARDKSGNTYVSDTYGYRIRKITSTGIISTIAGTGIAGYSGDNGPATSAKINNPIGMVFDAAGDLVFADVTNNRVRMINRSGIISTIAGNGNAGYSGDGGPATLATLNQPFDLAYDASGNLYISDHLNNVIRKVDTSGNISTFAGDNSTPGFCGDGGPALNACMNNPDGLATDSKGNLYISDSRNYRVREVSAGNINTIAGNGQKTDSGDGGQATQAGIGRPFGLSLQAGILYIATNADSRIRAVNLSKGIIETAIGSTIGYDGDGHSPSMTELDAPYGVLAISSTSILVVDRFNDRIRWLNGGLVKTVAGGYIGDGNPGTSASILFPESSAFDGAGNLFIPDINGNRIRKLNTSGSISTVAGKTITGYTGDGGPATSAELFFPQAAAVDSNNNVFIVDQNYTLIRKIDATTQDITTFSTNINFSELTGLAVDASNSLYATDAGACVVWKFDSNGNPTVVAGQLFNCGYNGDNMPATSAQLYFPWGLAFDPKGDMLIADAGNNRIRLVSPSGIISTIVGTGTACPVSTQACGDGGPATSAELNSPTSVALSGGTLYIADELDLRIRKVVSGTISTYAGTGLPGYNGNGLPALSTNFDDPISVAVDPVNKILYVVDDIQARVRQVH